MVFSKIHSSSLSYQTIQQVIDAIQGGKFSPGDRLPPERALAEILGVSRPTLRQALYALAVLGILEVRQGSGTYVRTTSIGAELAAKATELLATNDSPLQALEARLLLEPPVAAAAALAAEPADLEALRAVLEEMDRKVQRNEKLGSSDVEFHQIVARVPGNPYVEHAISLLLQTWFSQGGPWNELSDDILRAPGRLASYLEQHTRIYRSIERKNPDTARTAMHKHLLAVQEDFLRRSGRSMFEIESAPLPPHT